MFKSVFIKHTLPFLFWFISFVGVALLFDFGLHILKLVWVRRYLWITGTFILLFSFIYSLRKRKIVQSGTHKKLLLLHEYLAWFGSVLLLVHSGIHFNAVILWLATFTMLVVAFGIIGKYVLKDTAATLNQRAKDLAVEGLDKIEIEKNFSLILLWLTIWKNGEKSICQLLLYLCARSCCIF